jgi:hypothetical protein
VKQGRRRSIPPPFWGMVFHLYSQGYGYRRIADELLKIGVTTTKSSVSRLIRGDRPYTGRRVTRVVK